MKHNHETSHTAKDGKSHITHTCFIHHLSLSGRVHFPCHTRGAGGSCRSSSRCHQLRLHMRLRPAIRSSAMAHGPRTTPFYTHVFASTAADETRFCHSAPPRAPPDDAVATKPPRRRPGTEERPRGWRPTSTVAWRRARPALPRRPAAPRHQNESTSAPAATTSPCSCSRSCLRVVSLG